jgi:hypothetical protein
MVCPDDKKDYPGLQASSPLKQVLGAVETIPGVLRNFLILSRIGTEFYVELVIPESAVDIDFGGLRTLPLRAFTDLDVIYSPL